MSYTVDVNVLLYASDRESPFHDAAATFLRERAEDAGYLLPHMAGHHGVSAVGYPPAFVREAAGSTRRSRQHCGVVRPATVSGGE